MTQPRRRLRPTTQENLPDEVKKVLCKAHSSQTGEPCNNPPMRGATVCRMHGGAASHVKKAAKARLENAADRMARALLDLAETCPDPRVRLAAIRDALDRAGLAPRDKVALEVTKADGFLARVIRKGGTVDRSTRYDRRTVPIDDDGEDE